MMKTIHNYYENCLHSCDNGLVKTNTLLIEHFKIKIFADDN